MVFDLIVLGGGPGGYLAAERASHAGLKTVLLEKRALGGVCLNEGCVPSKSFLYSAKVLDYAKHGAAYGVSVSGVSYDHGKALARKNKVVSTLVSGIKAALKAGGVTLIEGEGALAGRGADGFSVSVNGAAHIAPKVIIATGSEAVVPPIPGVKESLESGFALTNREILDLPEIPKALVVVGGGVIGLEMASYFNSVGAKVTVVEMLDKIAGPNDREISAILQKNYEKKGVVFHLGAKVTEVRDGFVAFEKDGKTEKIAADKVLLSIGRRASTTGTGLESVGVYTERGAVVTDRFMKTNVAGIYAVGDVNGKSMLAHTAYREAEVAVNNMLGKRDSMRYGAIPSVIYTTPEVGAVGETAETAREKGIRFEEVCLPLIYSGRYVAENEGGDGVCKLLLEKKTRRLIGCHMICAYASEIIVSAGILIESQFRVDDIKEFVFPHPTVGEIIREGIFKF